jgi:hypothetical protein
MQPSPSLVKHYPLAVGLAILLLPYIYRLLVLPFTFRGYSAHPTSSVSSSTGKVVLKTSSIVQSISISTSTTTAGGFNLWKGVLQVIGPKDEDKLDKNVKTKRSTTTKSKAKSKSTSTQTVTSVKVTTVKDVKTVTKSITKSVTKSVTKSITKSITETVQVTLQNPVEESETDGSVVIEEINIMGWHQVFPFCD